MADSTSLTFRLFGVDVSASDTLDRLAEHAGRTGDHMKEKLAAGAAAGGAALVAGLMESFDQEQLNAKLAAQLDLNPAQAKAAGQTAAGLYSSGFGENLEQVNEGIKSVYQNIGDTSSAQGGLQGVTSKVLTLSQTFDQDLGGTTAAVGQLMKTGLARNADEALDIITKGLQSGADKSGDLLDTFNEYGTQFRKVGIDGATMTGILSQGLKGGARDADLVADSIKEFSIRAIDGSKTTAEGFKALGLNGKQMAADIAGGGPKAAAALDTTLDRLRGIKDPVKQSAAAVQLFGTQAEDMGKALYSIDPSKAVQGLGQVSGAAKKVVDGMGDTPAAKIETFKRGLSQGFTDVAGKLAQFATANSSWLVPLVGTLAGIAGAIWAVNAATTAWKATQTAISAVTKAWTAIQAAFNVVMNMNPIGLILIGLVALGAALVLAYQKSDTFRAIVQAAMKGVVAAFKWIVDAGKAAWDWLKPNVFDKIVLAAQVLGSWFKKLWTDYVTPAWNGIKQAISVVWGWIQTQWAAIKLGIQVLGQGFSNLWHNYVAPAWNGIKSAISTAWTWVNNNVFTPFKNGLSALGTAFERAKDGITTAWNKVKEAAAAPVRFVVNTVFGGIISKFNDIVSKVGVPTLPVPHVAFAVGGAVPSRLGRKGQDSVAALLTPDEHVWTTAEVDAAGGHAAVERLRALAMSGALDVSGDSGVAVVRGYADGGAVTADQVARVAAVRNWIPSVDPLPYVWGGVGPGGYDCSGLVGEVWARLTGRPSYRRYMTTNTILDSPGSLGLAPGPGLFSIGVSRTHTDGNLGGLGFEAASTKSGIHVGGAAKSVGSFPSIFHLSSFGTAGADTGGKGGGWLDPVGWAKAAAKKVIEAFVGPLWNKLSGMGGIVGQMAVGMGKKLIGGIFDSGGVLGTGASMVYNGTGRPEAVLTGSQWADVSSIASLATGRSGRSRLTGGGLGGGNVEVHLHLSGFAIGNEQQMVRQLKTAFASVTGTGLRFAGA
jgi:hypothetical protein